MNPAVAVVLGVALLGEPFGWATAAGFALILGGSAMATSGSRELGHATGDGPP